jgi:threonine aldolase
MRFASAQLLTLFADDLGVRTAAHANAMAARLRAALEELPGVGFAYPTQANAVFARIEPAAADRVRERYRFYDWDRAHHEVRWMCAFDTTEADVDDFVATVRAALEA